MLGLREHRSSSPFTSNGSTARSHSASHRSRSCLWTFSKSATVCIECTTSVLLVMCCVHRPRSFSERKS
eukprot:7360089-Prymnesium_polylepis.2